MKLFPFLLNHFRHSNGRLTGIKNCLANGPWRGPHRCSNHCWNTLLSSRTKKTAIKRQTRYPICSFSKPYLVLLFNTISFALFQLSIDWKKHHREEIHHRLINVEKYMVKMYHQWKMMMTMEFGMLYNQKLDFEPNIVSFKQFQSLLTPLFIYIKY